MHSVSQSIANAYYEEGTILSPRAAVKSKQSSHSVISDCVQIKPLTPSLLTTDQMKSGQLTVESC